MAPVGCFESTFQGSAKLSMNECPWVSVGFSPGTKVSPFSLDSLKEVVPGAPFTLIYWGF